MASAARAYFPREKIRRKNAVMFSAPRKIEAARSGAQVWVWMLTVASGVPRAGSTAAVPPNRGTCSLPGQYRHDVHQTWRCQWPIPTGGACTQEVGPFSSGAVGVIGDLLGLVTERRVWHLSSVKNWRAVLPRTVGYFCGHTKRVAPHWVWRSDPLTIVTCRARAWRMLARGPVLCYLWEASAERARGNLTGKTGCAQR
jgi:hypothetical protein